MNTAYHMELLAQITGGRLFGNTTVQHTFSELLTDSRKLLHPASTLFFALAGAKLNGHQYIPELYHKGVRCFVVTEAQIDTPYPEAQFVQVPDAKAALQKLAAYHRKQFTYPVIGITGSNGKTIVKEWLYQLLHEDAHIVRSPKSYNSQIGVPLSIWQMNNSHNLALIEAGISEPGEMEKLEKIIVPNIGLFTNIGDAHSEGFLNIKHKIKEKLKLFIHSDILIYCSDYADITQAIAEVNALHKADGPGAQKIKTFTWGHAADSDVQVLSILQQSQHSLVHIRYRKSEHDFEIPFTDKASVENALHCIAALLYMGKDAALIGARIKHLTGIEMRLEMKEALNQCALINDSYNSDIGSLRIAIDFLKQQVQWPHKTIILSDILQSGRSEPDLYEEVVALLKQHQINRLIGIGPAMMRQKKLFDRIADMETVCYASTDAFLKHTGPDHFNREIILLKGARTFRFERISRMLEKKGHETVLEINLNNLVHNLKTYQSLLLPQTKIMAMVKAFSYGSGSFEIANALQFNRCDYLAVAYADEGIDLRKHGIQLPIMVMNPEQRSFEQMVHYQLEPSLYTLHLLDEFATVAETLQPAGNKPLLVHIELETGMNRLGFSDDEIDSLIALLHTYNHIQVASVFTHLAGSEDPALDDFTHQQIAAFERMSTRLLQALNYPVLRHVLNSNGITRHTHAQYDMVRLGIGLYGIDSSASLQGKLKPVSTLKTSISQIKHIKAGESVGYGRVGKAQSDTTIATVSIGYADGLSRKLSNGRGQMVLHGKNVPIIGNVCMDMAMLDITGVAAKEGDEVIVFGNNPRIEDVALAAETIPYEILTGISARVKRVYVQE